MKTDRKSAKKESRAENAKKSQHSEQTTTRVLNRQIKQKKYTFCFYRFLHDITCI
jgi:hypothetical protein